AAIAAMKKNPGQEGKKLPAGVRIDMIKRMSYLLGLLAPDPGYSRFRFIIGWVAIGFLLLLGFVLPLVWVPYLAFSTRRSTLRLAARARQYYATDAVGEAGLIVRRGESRASLGGSVALGRTFLLIVLPIGAAVIALLTNTSPGGGRWLFAGLLFLALSFVATFLWLGFRWLRRTGRRLVRPPRPAPPAPPPTRTRALRRALPRPPGPGPPPHPGIAPRPADDRLAVHLPERRETAGRNDVAACEGGRCRCSCTPCRRRSSADTKREPSPCACRLP